MREDEAGRPRVLWRSHTLLNQISRTSARVSAAVLVAVGAANGLAARKNDDKGRNEERGGGKNDHTKDQENGRSRDHAGKNDEDRELRHEKSGTGNEDRGGRGQSHHRNRSDGESTDEKRHVNLEQNNNNNNNNDPTPTPTPTSTPDTTNGGGGGGGNGGGGNGGGGDGGGNNSGNAGSGFFDSPLATKARRRANDFENSNGDEDHGIVVAADPEGESVYETDSVSFTTGPNGIEILTDNIDYTSAATPTPTPFPGLDLPVREPGYPFGEDFPFGNISLTVTPATAEPTDPGDTTVTTDRPMEPAPAVVEPAPSATDGGDNTMDFTS